MTLYNLLPILNGGLIWDLYDEKQNYMFSINPHTSFTFTKWLFPMKINSIYFINGNRLFINLDTNNSAIDSMPTMNDILEVIKEKQLSQESIYNVFSKYDIVTKIEFSSRKVKISTSKNVIVLNTPKYEKDIDLQRAVDNCI